MKNNYELKVYLMIQKIFRMRHINYCIHREKGFARCDKC